MNARQWLGLVGFLSVLAPLPVLAQDVDPPVVSFLESGSPLVSGQRFGRVVVPVVAATDASAVTVELLLDGAAHTAGSTVGTEGTHELAVTATDGAQNVTSSSVTFVVDLTPPGIVGITPGSDAAVSAVSVVLTGEVTDAVGVTIDGTAVTLAGGVFLSEPLPLPSEGARNFAIVATDATGLTATRVHRIVRDTVAPTVSISQPLAGQLLAGTPVEVFGTVSDAHLQSVEVNGVAAVVSGSTWVARNVPLAEGPNPLTATARDRAGNESTATRSVTLDTRAPELQITDPAPGTLTPSGSIPISGLVVEPHVDRILIAGVRATVESGAFTALVSLAEGVNSLPIEAFDRAGHRSETTVIVTRDSQAPAIRILTPEEGSFLGTATTPVSGTVEEEENLSVTLNGGAVTRSPGAFSATDVALIEGENPLTARVTDGLGNQGAHTRLVFRDSVAPDFVSADPPSGASGLDPSSRFRLTFSEEIGGEEELGGADGGAVVLELAGGGLLPVDFVVTGRELTIVPRSPLPSEAALVLRLTSGIVDRAGNGLATPITLTYTVADVEAPAAPLLTPLPSSPLCASRAPISGTTEPEATVEVSGGASVASIRAAADGSFSLSVDLRPGVPQRLLVTARDPDGNVSIPSAIDLVHDCTPPQVVAADWAPNQSLQISFSEPVSAVSVGTAGALRVVSPSGDLPGTWGLSGAVAEFTPSGAALSGSFAITVTTAVQDLAGNPLATAFTRTFGDTTPASFVTGRVLDGATGRPLAGALVVVDSTDDVVYPEPQPSQTTGPDGRFRIAVPAGTHCLIFLRQGYTPVLRAATSLGGRGVDVFDPRLTPLAPLPAAGLARLTPLDEQSLPALLPYGWSPAGAVWIEVSDDGASAPLGLPAAQTFDVEDPAGAELALVHLDLATLQWHVEELVTVTAGQVSAELPSEGGWALVRADVGAAAPPAPTVGAVLSSSPVPVDPLLGAATVAFQPELVLPHQSSRATILLTLDPDLPSGIPVTVTIRESLTLLDGTVVAEPPFEADLVIYRSPSSVARARFALAPSAEARRVPLQLGAEDLVVRRYAGETVRGNVLGPLGGSVASLEGDSVELPPGALVEPVGIALARRSEADLGLTLPTSLEFLGALDLDLGGRVLTQGAPPAALRFELGTEGTNGQLLVFQVSPSVPPILHPVALAISTATGYVTAPIDDNDLPWPGVRTGATYVFARSTEPLGYFRGTVTADTQPVPNAPISALLSSSTQLFSWSSSSRPDGRYVFPAPLAEWTLTAVEPATGDRATASGTLLTVDERVDLPLFILPTGPFVVETTPADGATDQPAGTEPTVRFSELVDPATLAAGLFLEDADSNALVPTNLQLQGTTARLIPRASLVPGASYRIRATSAVRDLTGRLLSPAVSTTFTVRAVSTSDHLDLTRVHVLEPDAQLPNGGFARVLGRPGAVPAGSLVFVENTSRLASTPSVTAGADGSFDLEVQLEPGAGLADRLLLHVLPPGANETIAALPPFLTRDGRTAHVDSRSSQFTTLEGITVKVPAGAFPGPVEVTVVAESTARPRELPLPEDFTVRGAFRLDFVDADGAPVELLLPLDVRLAATGSGGELLLAHRWRPLGAPRWMLYDLLRQEGGEWTTEAPATAGTQAASRSGFDSGSGSGRLRLRSLAPVSAVASGTFGPLESAPFAATLTDRQRRLPGVFDSGRYLVLEPASPLDYFVLPLSLFDSLFVQSTSLPGMAAGVSPRFSTQLGALGLGGGLLVPTRRGEPLGLVGRDLSTGFEVFRVEAPAPAPGTIQDFAPDPADHEPPVPVDGSPFRFVPIEFRSNGVETLLPGVQASFSGGTLTIAFAAGTLAAGTHASLVAVGSPGATVRAGDGGEVTLTLAAQLGKSYLLAIGAPVAATGTIRIAFSEALRDGALLDGFAGLTVRAPNGNDAHARITPLGSREVLEIAPAAGWQAGGRYVLELAPTLADAQGNAWGVDLALPFEIEKSPVLARVELTEVRDVAHVGDWLLVAAGEQGLAVLDASNPAALGTPALHPFPLADPVQGLAVDPHGRVLVTGGGVHGFGQLKIFDPLTGAYVGSTLVSDALGNDLSSLPEGTPRRVTVLSEDARHPFVLGGSPPAGFTVASAALPGGGQEVTLTGTGTPKLPVSLINRTRGRWARVDADAAGAFSISIEGEPGDGLELVQNERSVAYVTVRGVGILAVDVNAFYRETHETVPVVQSDVLGWYSGQDDPNLQLCGQPVAEIGTALLDLDTLIAADAAAPHRLTLAGLVGFRGVALFEADPADLAALGFYNESCLRLEGNAAVAALEALPDYAFRSAQPGPAAPPRDYLVVAHRTAGLLILDAEDRDNLVLVSRIPLPIEAAEVALDRQGRRAYVSGTGGGLAIVDLDRPPSDELLDLDRDGRDDRVLEVIELPGNTNAPALVVPELGLAFAGGVDGAGVTAISIAEPRMAAVRIGEEGELGREEELGPHGVPSPTSRDLPGTFRILASLPGLAGDEIKLDVFSLGPGGLEIDGAGDPAVTPGLPPTSLTGDDGLILRRLSPDPRQDGHHTYLSEEIAVVADLRAAPGYQRTADESADCPRCEVAVGTKSILAGNSIAVRLPDSLSTQLLPLYGPQRLARLGLDLPATPWDTTCSPDQEPAQNASRSAAGPPGVLLHSGELTLSAVDLTLPGIGLDLVVARHYRSGTIGNGPLGPGWELGYRQRLRELKTGDVEYRDGTGRCETFRRRADGEGYESPSGRFVDLVRLERQTTGWLFRQALGETLHFDRFGRLTSIADAARTAAERGNEIRLRYDAHSRLVAILDTLGHEHRLEYDLDGRLTALVDFQGRRTEYGFDNQGRLETVTTPPIPTGEVTFPQGLTTTYRYVVGTGGTLAQALHERDNLTAWTDPAGTERATWTYADANNDGRWNEITDAFFDGGSASVAYDFEAKTATIVDRVSQTWLVQHDAAGHPIAQTDPSGATWTSEYDPEGNPTESVSPTGIRETRTYPTGTDTPVRSRGNAETVVVAGTASTPAPSVAGAAVLPSESPTSRTMTVAYDPELNRPIEFGDDLGLLARAELSPTLGKPTAITAAPGTADTATSRVEYDDRGRRTKATDAAGRETTYAYSALGFLETMTERGVPGLGAAPVVTRYETDARGNVTAVIDPRGTRTERVYDELDRLVEESIPAASVVTKYLRDALGRVTEIKRSAGDSGGEVARERFTYAAEHDRPLAIERELTSGVFAREEREYDAEERLVRTVDPTGLTTTLVYDDVLRTVTRTHTGAGLAQAVVERTEYDEDGRETAFVDGRGQRWETSYDALGRVTERLDPLGNARKTVYDARGRVKSDRFRSAAGCLLAQTDADYNARDLTTRSISWLWSGLACPTAATGTALTTEFSYDPTNLPLSVVDPLGRTQENRTYDPLGRLTRTVDALGNTIDSTLDPGSLVLTTTATEGGAVRTESYRYDALGRRTAMIDGVGETWSFRYDTQSNLRLAINPAGTFTETTYDLANRATATIRPEGIRVEQSYDAAGRLITYRDALGQVTTYTYDALGRRLSTVYPDATTETRAYDGAGNPIQIQDPRGTAVTQSFDAAGRLIARDMTLGAGVIGPTHETFDYDGLDRLIFAQSGPGAALLATTERQYDSLSRMTSETTNGRTVTSAYDAIGARTGLVYPSGASYQATVDALGRPSSLTQLFSSSPEPRAAFTYQGFRRTSTTLGDSLTATSAYDPAQRLTSRNWSVPVTAPSLSESLAWTPKNLIAGVTRTPDSLGHSTFTYDQANRLTAAQRTRPQVLPATQGTSLRSDSYSYDSAENLLGHTEQTQCDLLPETKTFPLDASGRNRPGSAGSQTLEWDASGNLVRKGNQRFQYDYRNRLTRVSDAIDTEIARYAYDVFNRRVKKEIGLDVNETVWDGWEPIEEYRNGQLTSRRLFGPNLGELLRLENDLDGNGTLEQTYLPVFDVLGNLTELRREDGSIVERYDYSPFGERRVIAEGADPCDGTEISAAGNGFGFHGLGRDEETGLLYARNRYYDPEMGRFVSVDPLGYVDGPNGYQYGVNSPGNYVDALGLCSGTGCADLADIWSATNEARRREAAARREAEQIAAYEALLNKANSYLHSLPSSLSKNEKFDAVAEYLYVRRSLVDQTTAYQVAYDLVGDFTCDPGNRLCELEVEMYRRLERPKKLMEVALFAEMLLFTGPTEAGPALEFFGELSTLSRVPRGQTTVIGKVKDLENLRPGENALLRHLPDQGNPRANWAQNSGVLRREMAKGRPIRDASVDPVTGELIDYPGSFLNAERNLLRDRGWTYDAATHLWSPL